MTKTVYQIGANGAFVSVVELDETDLCPRTGKVLIPGGCIEIAPPAPKDGYLRMFNGQEWTYEPIPTPEPTPAPVVSEREMRLRRNSLLRESDWTQLSDSPLNREQKAAWRAYRQALRAITEHPDFPNVALPEPPK